jgi:hypothetical protein
MQYQIYVDGEPIGQPMSEKEARKRIKLTARLVTNTIEMIPYVPEQELVTG